MVLFASQNITHHQSSTETFGNLVHPESNIKTSYESIVGIDCILPVYDVYKSGTLDSEGITPARNRRQEGLLRQLS